MTKKTKGWAEFKFPPINLWSLPKQYRDWINSKKRGKINNGNRK